MLLNRKELYRCMDEQDLDFIIGASYQNVYYMSDFFSPNPYWLNGHITLVVFPRDENREPVMVLSKSEAELLATSPGWIKEFRLYGDAYIEDDGKELLSEEDSLLREYLAVEPFGSAALAAADALVSLGMKKEDRIGVDERGMSAPFPEILAETICHPVVYASAVIEKARLIKTPGEVQLLKKSVRITEQSIRASMEQAWLGMSESDMAKIYRTEVCRRGAEPMLTCIGFGTHSAHANAQPTDYIKLGKDMPIRFDIGCSYKHYQSDTARIAVIGELSEREEKIFAALKEGIELGISKIKPGVKYSEIFHVTMDYIHEFLPIYRRSHVGHGIGVEIYDAPVIGETDFEFKKDMVCCVEAPYYEVGLGGYQVEEVVHITDKGSEVISERPVGIMRY